MSVLDSIHYPTTVPGACAITAGINAPSLTRLLVHPVPAYDILHVSELPEGNWDLAVYTLDGRCISSGVLLGSYGSIGTALLSPGVYLLELRQKGQSLRRTFIKG